MDLFGDSTSKLYDGFTVGPSRIAHVYEPRTVEWADHRAVDIWSTARRSLRLALAPTSRRAYRSGAGRRVVGGEVRGPACVVAEAVRKSIRFSTIDHRSRSRRSRRLRWRRRGLFRPGTALGRSVSLRLGHFLLECDSGSSEHGSSLSIARDHAWLGVRYGCGHTRPDRGG